MTAVLLAAAPAGAQNAVRVSVGLNGEQPNGSVGQGRVSGDGRFVVFASEASNLVAGDTNGSADVFVRDLAGATTTRVSLASDGQERVGHNGTVFSTLFDEVDISDDGRYVVFTSRAALVPGDTGLCQLPPTGSSPVNCPDVYLRDRQTNETVRISVAVGGGNADGTSRHPRISGDGRYVVFHSDATNLVAGDTNGAIDVFLVDRQSGTTARVSVGPGGTQVDAGGTTPSISDDGSVIGFLSTSAQLSPEPDTVACQPIPFDTQIVPCFRPFIFDRGRNEALRVPMPALETSGVLAGSTPVAYTVRVDARAVVPSDDGSSVAVGVHTAWTLRRQGVPVTIDHGWIYDRTLGRITHEAPDLTPHAWTGRALAFSTYRQGAGLTILYLGAVGVFEPAWNLREVPPGGAGVPTAMGNISDDGSVLAYWTGAGLTGSDTDGQGDVYVLDRDPDGDTMPSTWETQFGLDPLTADASADPDGDGVNNADEYLVTGSHPRGTHVRYLAEGAHNAFFRTDISVVGLGRTGGSPPDQTAVVRYLNPFARVWSESLTLYDNRPRHASLAVQLTSDFSTVIESDGPIVVDREMTWGNGYGSHAETAAAAAATTWHLAEGATHGGFDLFYLIQNPGTAANTITITYLRPAPLPPIVRTMPVLPQSRTTIQVDAIPGLEATDVSAVITGSAPILVERAMYMNVGTPPQIFGAGHAGAGIAAPAERWFLAEGATGPFFDLYYLLANPTSEPTRARVSYLRPTGAPIVREYPVAAQSRVTISVDGEDPGLDNTPVSAIVESLDGARLVVERSMWWPGGGQWQEGHLAAGTTASATRWTLAAGRFSLAGPTAQQMFVLIANTSSTAGVATITASPESTSVAPVSRTVELPPNSRTTVPMHALFAGLEEHNISTIVQTDGVEVVVERALYADANGIVWAAGSAALGTPQQP